MIFLTQRSAQAVIQIGEIKQLNEIAKSVDEFASRRDQFVRQCDAFAPLLAQVRLFRARGLNVTAPQLIYFLLKEFSQLQQEFETQPESLTQTNLNKIFNQSQNCQQALRDELERVWHEYVDAKRLKLDQALLGVLSVVPAFGDAVAYLEEWDEKIEAQRNRVPTDKGGFENLQRSIDEMQRIWNDLGGAGLPADLVNFLRIAGDKSIGARLELLDQIRPWLKDRGLEGSFRVVISG